MRTCSICDSESHFGLKYAYLGSNMIDLGFGNYYFGTSNHNISRVYVLRPDPWFPGFRMSFRDLVVSGSDEEEPRKLPSRLRVLDENQPLPRKHTRPTPRLHGRTTNHSALITTGLDGTAACFQSDRNYE